MEPRLFTFIGQRFDGLPCVSLAVRRGDLPGRRLSFGGYLTRDRARHAVALANEFLGNVLRRQGVIEERDVEDAYWFIERQPTLVIDDVMRMWSVY